MALSGHAGECPVDAEEHSAAGRPNIPTKSARGGIARGELLGRQKLSGIVEDELDSLERERDPQMPRILPSMRRSSVAPECRERIHPGHASRR
jgi:hypothetical protein